MDPLKEIQQTLLELASKYMPFGKYGPKNFPPRGLLLCDLPFEYLRWMKKTGFPAGHLGQLMAVLYQLKMDGAEDVFKPLRQNIPRQSFRKSPQKINIRFDD
ncbi:MAG: DUF3820 family protein [Lentisphaeria bacterium]